MIRLRWYAAGGGVARCGPFASQVEAWEAMRLAPDIAARERLTHPRDTRVWPERAR
jgi:hypothetical protein